MKGLGDGPDGLNDKAFYRAPGGGCRTRARKPSPMVITIRIHDVRVVAKGEDRGPHIQAIGYMQSGQELIRGMILAGHSPSVRADAVADVVDWLRKHRPAWAVDLSKAVCS